MNSQLFKILKSFPNNLKIKAILILFLSLVAMIIEIISVSLVAPLTSTMINLDAFKSQNFLNKIVFNIFEKSNFENLLLFCLTIFGIFFILRIIFGLTLQLMSTYFSFKVFQFMTKKILKTYLQKKWSFFLDRHTAEIIRNTMDETAVFRSSVVMPLTNILSEIFIFFGIVSFLLFYETKTTLVMIFIFGFFGIFYRFLFKKKINFLASKRQFYSTRVNQNILEIFKLVKEIKLYFKEKIFFDKYSSNIDNYIKSNYKYNLISIIPRYFLEFLVLLVFFSIIAFNYLSKNNFITFVPIISVYLLAAFRILPSIVKILRSIQSLDWGGKSIHLIYKIIDSSKNDIKFENSKKIKKLVFNESIRLKNINFSYDSKKILNNFNLEINKYDIVGIIGKSGSGKTTLINIIMGLLTPSKGNIYLDNIKINKNIRGWQKNISLVQQESVILDDTIKNNIILDFNVKNIDKERYIQSINDAALSNYINSLPQKDLTVTGENGVKISGGQKQRISIARALYQNPEVLVLDEATSSLDADTEQDIFKSLKNIKGKKTIIIISHRESSLKLCNKIIRLG